MARKLIEKYRRKTDLNLESCVPIQLADGQEWYFPRPMIELRPRFDGSKPISLSRYVTWGEDLDDLLLAVSNATTADGDAIILAVLRLGGDMLLQNYDLTQEELQQLFRYRIDDPTGNSDEMFRTIIEVATGRLRGYAANPKRPADGFA